MAKNTSTTVIDIDHPYYLSSSDHPGLSLVTKTLNNQNYHHWSRSIQIALSAKLKLGSSMALKRNLQVLHHNLLSGNEAMICAKLEKYEQLIKLSQFLMGLNDQFTSVRGQILLMQPLPDINQAYSMLLQEENQRDFATQTSIITENAAMNVKFHPPTAPNKSKQTQRKVTDPSLHCDYCNLSGHLKEKCFALHGYPDWHRLHGQPKPKPRAPKRIFNAVMETTDTVATSSGQSSPLSDAQCQLVQMLQTQFQSTPKMSNAAWIGNSSTSTNTQCAGPCCEEGDRDW